MTTRSIRAVSSDFQVTQTTKPGNLPFGEVAVDILQVLLKLFQAFPCVV